MRRAGSIRCPTCRKSGDWLSGASAPFCSQRCKLIDLGKWLGGEHVISEPLRGEHLEQYAELPSSEKLDQPERREDSNLA